MPKAIIGGMEARPVSSVLLPWALGWRCLLEITASEAELVIHRGGFSTLECEVSHAERLIRGIPNQLKRRWFKGVCSFLLKNEIKLSPV